MLVPYPAPKKVLDVPETNAPMQTELLLDTEAVFTMVIEDVEVFRRQTQPSTGYQLIDCVRMCLSLMEASGSKEGLYSMQRVRNKLLDNKLALNDWQLLDCQMKYVQESLENWLESTTFPDYEFELSNISRLQMRNFRNNKTDCLVLKNLVFERINRLRIDGPISAGNHDLWILLSRIEVCKRLLNRFDKDKYALECVSNDITHIAMLNLEHEVMEFWETLNFESWEGRFHKTLDTSPLRSLSQMASKRKIYSKTELASSKHEFELRWNRIISNCRTMASSQEKHEFLGNAIPKTDVPSPHTTSKLIPCLRWEHTSVENGDESRKREIVSVKRPTISQFLDIDGDPFFPKFESQSLAESPMSMQLTEREERFKSFLKREKGKKQGRLILASPISHVTKESSTSSFNVRIFLNQFKRSLEAFNSMPNTLPYGVEFRAESNVVYVRIPEICIKDFQVSVLEVLSKTLSLHILFSKGELIELFTEFTMQIRPALSLFLNDISVFVNDMFAFPPLSNLNSLAVVKARLVSSISCKTSKLLRLVKRLVHRLRQSLDRNGTLNRLNTDISKFFKLLSFACCCNRLVAKCAGYEID